MERAIQESGSLLIVDDDEINRVILANIFEDTYNIVEAEDGAAGLEKVAEYKKNLCAILLDMAMPVLDGLGVLRKLHELELMDQIPVFLITCETDSNIIRQSYDLGVMDVISKPVTPWIVRRRVDSVIELFQARRRLTNTVDLQKDKILQQANQIFQLSLGMIESLGTAIEFRSCESGEHVRRIFEITYQLCSKTPFGANFTQEEIRNIALASIMHDVGKIAIPDAILNKPGRLTKEEFEIMKTHTLHGCELLSKIPQMRELGLFRYAYDIARWHHERWDGRGYPDGLVGENIPIWAQIVSIADVYDALVSRRIYKEAFSFDEALQMITSGQCGTFNPRLLQEFLSVESSIRSFYTQGVMNVGSFADVTSAMYGGEEASAGHEELSEKKLLLPEQEITLTPKSSAKDETLKGNNKQSTPKKATE